ncbi:C4-dicarboxylate TRAP transporter substrate-binding protein [Clostridium sp. E02]|uniref:C4-dicarboxylate TRAP transporter substrate-binding protein n=1 Tax=Clostridium sp. E02 TaxID=2487134 RepID=UPI000F52AD2C|nr:C4-dicarboxylate TRAP transporter substrate-binding protein [Clostridium sp. E02]
MKKQLMATLLIAAMTISMTGCGAAGKSGSTGKKGDKYTLKLGTVLTEADPIYKGLEEFKKNVEEKTDGNVTIELYSGSQLGADEDVLEQAKVGAGVGIITDPGRMSNYIKDFGILSGPYLADDYEGALALMNTSVYKELADQFQNDGFKILSFNYYQGSRNLFTKSPVSKPEDLNGLRIRSSGSDVVTKSLEAMGANTTVLAWSEAYQALQQKVIEGVEVHNSAAVGSSIYEVTDYVTLTGHFQLLTGLVISNGWFEKLPAEYQTILEEESFKAGKFASDIVIEKDSEYLQKCIDGGVEVVDCDKEAFKAAADKAYDELGYRELKDKLMSELGK